jgi:hypothetical protein
MGGAAGPQPRHGLGNRLGTLRFLVHDRDPVFTTAFGEVFSAEGLRIITTLPRTPRMNAICERVIGTLRRELLDRTLILGERHLALVLREYLIHYNGHRPHQSWRQRPPDIEMQPVRDVANLRLVADQVPAAPHGRAQGRSASGLNFSVRYCLTAPNVSPRMKPR